MLSFPARFFVDFFERHGFLNVDNRPHWQAVNGGSREYVRKLAAPFRHRIRLDTRVAWPAPHRQPGAPCAPRGASERFDHVFIACHSDQALRHAGGSDAGRARGARRLSRTQANEAVLHTDERLLPRTSAGPRRLELSPARHARQFHAQPAALTYDMNLLQTLDAPVRFLVTLNRSADIDPARIIRTMTYHHPVYLPAGVAAQKRRAEISGVNRTFYCGA